MKKAVIDTDILSEMLRGRNVFVMGYASIYRKVHGRFTISAVTVMEIAKGLHKCGRDGATSRFTEALPQFEILPFDTQVALLAGRIYGGLESTGQTIGHADPMIAATALVKDLVLVTGNVRHFGRIRALGYPLAILDWRTPGLRLGTD